MTYHGHVVGIAAGSGNAFALLPSQNASGNWIKIVQRLPVRILLDPDELKAHPLRVGLSTTVRVDLHDTSGPAHDHRPCAMCRSRRRRAPGDDPAVGTRIAAIIADNAGPARRTSRRGSAARERPRAANDALILAAGS